MNLAAIWLRRGPLGLALAGLLGFSAPGYAQNQGTIGSVLPAPAADFYRQPPTEQEPTQTTTQGPQAEPGAPTIEKSRKLSRSFRAPLTHPYLLNTRYGRVQVNVWTRKEIRTDVDIITRADSEEKAQQLQEMIQVTLLENDPATNGGISVRSKFGAIPGGCASRQRLFEVNYTVWVPKNQALAIANTFGDVSITGDLTAPVDLSMEYGTLRAGRLEGSSTAVHVKNGSATLEYVRRAILDASYAKLRLDAGDVVELRNNYSDIDIGTVQDLTVHSKYGDVALGTVRNLSGTSGFGRFSVDKVSERLDMKVQHCPAFEVRNTSPNFRQINLDGGYSTILLNFPDGTGFNFDVNTQFGKLLVDKRLVTVRSEESSSASSDLQGQYGRTTPRQAGSVNIKARYTNVSFNK
ncbi:hypothetical protein HER32_07495 [Hymenobacter sp. BT18]|uniref:hypothetical protein n=1 Tax=Hymenobacter sp. BT18 TaxID=2835648 RepID=UPI00143E72C3|nr:hypothetical protein [Hymenobacter sp. BT18]QIX61033.1 hypothetical protein HER32_07495 [Hymenobacter sp. BT18]